MLKTREERVKLLKSGIQGKTIEKLYLIYNDIKMINKNILFVENYEGDFRKIVHFR